MTMFHGEGPARRKPAASRATLTMADIARAAGVSPMTVSNTFRHPGRVQPETRARVLAIAAELGYVPNISAGSLAAGGSRVLGAVLPSLRNSSFFGFTRGLREAAAAEGHELILMVADSLEEERRAVETLIGLRVAGIAMIGGEHDPGTRALLERAETPVVEAWPGETPLAMAVGYDVGAASAALTRHVIARGCRRIGFVGFSGGAAERYSDRLPAFRLEMFRAGLPDDLVTWVKEADGFGAGPHVLDALLARAPQLDALLCPTDIVAAGALFECSRRGLRVPQDIAVAGWGNYEIAGQVAPALTTIEPRSVEIGRRAVALILAARAGKAPPATSAHTDFELVLRESA